jgi:hypothetical protein
MLRAAGDVRRCSVLVSVSSRVIVVATTAVAVIGAVDAIRGRNGDLVVVFLVVAALQALLLVRLQFGRRPIPLRPDLVAWLDERASITGEPPERIADRCISEYRAGLRKGG